MKAIFKILIIFIVIFSFTAYKVNAFSTDLTDYIFADTGDQQINNSILISPVANSDIDTQGWETVEAPSWTYCDDKDKFGNLSICSNQVSAINKYGFGNEFADGNVTIQFTIFDNSADTGASTQFILRNVGDSSTIMQFGIVTTTDSSNYVFESTTVPTTTSNISRTDEAVNFTWEIAPAIAYIVGYINNTKIINESSGLSQVEFLRLIHDSASNLNITVDDIYVWSGTREDRPQPSFIDSTAPIFASTAINNTAPIINEDVQVSASITDETNLASVFYANNITGTFLNVSSINFTESQLAVNYSVNITNTLSFGTVGHIFTANDTSGNSAQSTVITYTVQETQNPNFQAESINNTLPRINEVVLISQVVSDETQLDFVVLAHNQSGILTNQTPIDISGTSFNATDTITVTLAKGAVVGYQWAVNDTSGNSNTSVIRTFTVQNTAPEAPTILAPTADFFTNFLPVDFNVTFNQDADGDVLTIHYFINSTLNQTSLTNTTFNASDNLYFLEVSITDGDVFTANVSVTFEIDTTNPLIILTNPTNQSSHSADIPIDISCTDLNPFILNYTFFNGSNIIRTAQDNVSTANTLTIIDTIPIENLSDGGYNLNISCSDAHTKNFIPDYTVVDIANGKLFITDQDVSVQIVHIGQPINQNINHVKLDDRYTFEFGTTPTRENHTFKVITAKHEIQIIDSDFKGHLVITNGIGGNWLDFENGDELSTVTVKRINKKQVDVSVFSNDFNFNSIGGLNVVQQQLNITIDTTVAPAITGLAVLPLENASSLVGMVALFIILFGLIATLFRRKEK